MDSLYHRNLGRAVALSEIGQPVWRMRRLFQFGGGGVFKLQFESKRHVPVVHYVLGAAFATFLETLHVLVAVSPQFFMVLWSQ